MKASTRIDQLLVDRGLAESRQKAQALVMAGQVLVDEQKIDKPGRKVDAAVEIRLLGETRRYVSRGGLKLEAALERFAIDVAGKRALDVGSSTGGFTDCLLQHGAASVCAVDVGTNQLDWKIRQDPRVDVREQVNARYLDKEDFPAPFDFVSCDLSFISATLVLPAIAPLLAEGAEIVVLAKPQFEVGREQVGKGGVVRDPELHRATVEKVSAAIRAIGFARIEAMDSPILGAEGNREFLVHGADRTPSAGGEPRV